jgi:iron complex transport system substrate-binding protein
MIRAVAVAALLGAALLLGGCGGTDSGGVRRQDEPRIVVLSPAAAEMLEALDALDRVVGIGDFGPWPAAIEALPRVGGYDSPNVERLLELRCGLLVTARSEAAAVSHRRLAELGIRVEALDTGTYAGLLASLRRLGELLGNEPAAAAAEQEMRAQLDALATEAADLPARTVLFVVGRDPLYVAGPGSHVDEMLGIAGGVNVAHDALSPYQQVSLEVILERMPEVIIDASDNRPGALRGRRPGAWGAWEFLPAVQQDRVYWVDPGLLLIPGLRLPEMTRLTGRLIHPERFGAVSDDELRLPAVTTAEER